MSEIEIEFGDAANRINGPVGPLLDMVALLTGEPHDLILAKSIGLYVNSLAALETEEANPPTSS